MERCYAIRKVSIGSGEYRYAGKGFLTEQDRGAWIKKANEIISTGTEAGGSCLWGLPCGDESIYFDLT